MKRSIPALAVALAVALMAPATGTAATSFGAPVKVTPDLGYGYEPAAYTDRFGNVFATAHKENFQLALAPDANSPAFTRSMSWAWISGNDGQSFEDLPGLSALSLEQHDFGDEGDMAVDDSGHLYFVDTNVADVTYTRWSVAGKGAGHVTLDYHRPLLPAAEPVDDRPWVEAHGSGKVFYLGNEGDRDTYVSDRDGGGDASGPGRYTVYRSTTDDQTFDSQGYTLNESGWCRPAADHRPGSTWFYVFCTDDNGTLFSYASGDDGQHFQRYKAGTYNAQDTTQSWPTVRVAPDGTLYALYVDAAKVDAAGVPTESKLVLLRSADHGRTWSRRNVTPMRGHFQYGWLSISPDGSRLGIGIYFRPNGTSDWHVYGAAFAPGGTPRLTLLDPTPVQDKHCGEAPGDLMGSAFNPDGTLGVIWTRNTQPSTCGSVTQRDIYYARSTR